MENLENTLLLGYCIMRNHKYKASRNGKEWFHYSTGFKLDFIKRRLYESKAGAIDALKQLQKFDPEDDFKIHPVYLGHEIKT